MVSFIPSQPYDWPFDGNLSPDNTALIVIDMQIDFCGEGGYVDEMGYDISLTRAPIRPISDTLNVMRTAITLSTLARVTEMISQISRIINVGGRKKLVRV